MEINKSTSEYYLDAILGSSNNSSRPLQVENNIDGEDVLNPKDKTSISPEARQAADQMRSKSIAEQAGGNGQHGATPNEDPASAENEDETSLKSDQMGGSGASQSSPADKIAELKAKLEQLGSRLSQVMNSNSPDGVKEAQAAPIEAQMSEIAAQISELEAQVAKEKA